MALFTSLASILVVVIILILVIMMINISNGGGIRGGRGIKCECELKLLQNLLQLRMNIEWIILQWRESMESEDGSGLRLIHKRQREEMLVNLPQFVELLIGEDAILSLIDFLGCVVIDHLLENIGQPLRLQDHQRFGME